jgi:hypothetical protein
MYSVHNAQTWNSTPSHSFIPQKPNTGSPPNTALHAPPIIPQMPIRSRSGCAECKRRRRKCDETRPGCLACRKRDIHCGGYGVNLQWGVGIASRGRFVGATIPVQTAEKGSSTCSARKALGSSSSIYSSRRSSCTTDRSAGSTCSPPNQTSFEPSHELQDGRSHIRRSVEDLYLFDQGAQLSTHSPSSIPKINRQC